MMTITSYLFCNVLTLSDMILYDSLIIRCHLSRTSCMMNAYKIRNKYFYVKRSRVTYFSTPATRVKVIFGRLVRILSNMKKRRRVYTTQIMTLLSPMTIVQLFIKRFSILYKHTANIVGIHILFTYWSSSPAFGKLTNFTGTPSSLSPRSSI